MSVSKKKLLFEVKDNETIDQCLDRMKKAGYFPVRRLEKPIFKELDNGGEFTYQPVGSTIVFEGRKQEEEKPNIN